MILRAWRNGGTGRAAGQELCRYTHSKACNGGILREHDTDKGEKKRIGRSKGQRKAMMFQLVEGINTENEGFWMGSL